MRQSKSLRSIFYLKQSRVYVQLEREPDDSRRRIKWRANGAAVRTFGVARLGLGAIRACPSLGRAPRPGAAVRGYIDMLRLVV
eukprot:1153702-Pleurochrysis_carterae.AAC.3